MEPVESLVCVGVHVCMCVCVFINIYILFVMSFFVLQSFWRSEYLLSPSLITRTVTIKATEEKVT